MLKRLSKIALMAFVLGYVAIGALLYVKQRDILYHPTPDIQTDYKGFVLKDGNVSTYIHILNEGHKNAILYFGGNAESMAKSSDYIAQQLPEFTCYLMDYRGYGSSTGKPSEEAIYKDALALYDKVKEKHARISIGGRSLGTSVAAYVAAHREVIKLALITPFDSIVSIAQERYPLYPASLLLKDTYKLISYVKDIKAKTFVVMAEYDKVVSKSHSLRLIKAFKKGQVVTTVIKNRGHIDISDDERYYKIMQDFIGGG